MLTHIKKIKNFGVFDNYATEGDVKFNRYNVIYGENGSGKTTLSRLLACLEVGEHPDHPSLEYSIESQSGALAEGKKYPRRIRVFNSDFVEANIGKLDGPLRHILILGEENKAVAQQLKAEIVTRDARISRIAALTANINKAVIDRGKLFSQVARTIGEATSGSILRQYRKQNAEAAFARLSASEPLSYKELEQHRATVHQDQMDVVKTLVLPLVYNGIDYVPVLESAQAAGERTKTLAARTVQSAVIERLANDPNIASWVETGIFLHKGKNICEFCAQPLSAERLKTLADHFSVEDHRLKDEIQLEIAALNQTVAALNKIEITDRLHFYSELRSDYDEATNHFYEVVPKVIEQLSSCIDLLNQKNGSRTTIVESNISTDARPLSDVLFRIETVKKRHNDKTESFENEKAVARDAIETHYLMSIKEQADNFKSEADSMQTEADKLQAGGEGLEDRRSMEELSASILEKQALVSNAHLGGSELTVRLAQFLGRTELRFEASDDGYAVLRKDKPARRLSEGERTAVAFIYFLVQLKDHEFDLKDGVIVIDDPVSSLDASSLYQAFSFLKNGTKDAKQLFILTHNFEFMRLVLNWMKFLPENDRAFTMVICSEAQSGRSAKLAPLDKLLLEHATEYHYLFKRLYNFKSDGTILGCYHVPNMARKVLETFLDFHIPSRKKLYLRLEDLNFDPHKKTAIWNFANDLSHFTGKGFDPALVAETQKNTAYLLEMIEAVAPSHYKGLKALAEA